MTAPASPAARAPREEAAKSVVYTGDAGTREITAAQWKGAGVEGQAKTVWNADNDYTLPASEFSAEALEVLKRDRNIQVR